MQIQRTNLAESKPSFYAHKADNIQSQFIANDTKNVSFKQKGDPLIKRLLTEYNAIKVVLLGIGAGTVTMAPQEIQALASRFMMLYSQIEAEIERLVQIFGSTWH